MYKQWLLYGFIGDMIQIQKLLFRCLAAATIYTFSGNLFAKIILSVGATMLCKE